MVLSSVIIVGDTDASITFVKIRVRNENIICVDKLPLNEKLYIYIRVYICNNFIQNQVLVSSKHS